MLLPPTYVVLDGASTVLTLLVAMGFLRVGLLSRQGLHFALSAGFTLVAAGFLFVSLSYFGGPQADLADALRVVLQLTGAMALFLAYASYHGTGRTHALAVAFGAVGTTVAVGTVLWFVPPAGILPPPAQYLAVANALMAAAYLGCALLSGYGWHKRPTWGRAMVPLGFLCWTFSKYTWIFIVLGKENSFLPVVYTWRFTAILLMLWAMARPARAPSARLSDATA